jgi:hypothetical protein
VQVAGEQPGRYESVDLGLVHHGGAQPEPAAARLPLNERAQRSHGPGEEARFRPHEIGERVAPREAVQLLAGISARVHRADDGPHAGADDEVGTIAEPIEHLQYPDVGQPLGTAAGQHEGGPGVVAGLGLHRSNSEQQ